MFPVFCPGKKILKIMNWYLSVNGLCSTVENEAKALRQKESVFNKFFALFFIRFCLNYTQVKRYM